VNVILDERWLTIVSDDDPAEGPPASKMTRVDSVAFESQNEPSLWHNHVSQSQTEASGSKCDPGLTIPASSSSATHDQQDLRIQQLYNDPRALTVPEEETITRGQPLETMPNQVVIKFSDQPEH